jgi:2-oxoglutarate dehydrogenase E2 component (dihydrolipoamide succinyltransferase)
VDVNTLLAVISNPGELVNGQVSPISSGTTASSSVPATVSPVPEVRRPVSPSAKRLAKELGIDVSQVPGTGEDGLVTEKDVRLFVSQQAEPAPNKSEDAQVIPLVGQRLRIAERMSLSRRTAADVTTVMDVDMEQVSLLHSKTGFSYTTYVTWAAAQALCEFPLLNAWIEDDRIVVISAVHMGIAVAIEGALVVPVLRNAERKSAADIDRDIDALGEKARAGLLTPDDMKGSTFTVTNSGVFGSLMFTPIINLPEVAILGMGKVADTPVVRQGQVVPGKVMYLCLSYDQRAVDGAMAVQFLQAIKHRLEKPE